MKKENFNFIIAALILLNIYTIFKLNSMERTLDDNVQYLDREQRNLSREIDDIYFNVDEKLKKQASILDSYDVTFGDKLTEDLTVPVSISITPKKNTDNLTADLMINDKRYSMQKTGTTFTASINAYIFDPFQIKVILNDNSTEKIETIDDYDNMEQKYILEIHGDFLGDTKYSSGKYQYDGDIVINSYGHSNNSAEKVSISRYINGEISDEQEVDIQGNEPIMHSVKDEVELSANDRIEIFINVQDKYGINYKYIVKADEIDSEGKLVRRVPEWTNGSLMEIKDKNGKILFKSDYVNN